MADPPLLEVPRPNPTRRVVERGKSVTGGPSAADGLVGAGVVLVTAAVWGLAGLFWALGALGVMLMALGVARARTEGP